MRSLFSRIPIIKRDPALASLVLAGLVFFGVYAWLPLTSPSRFVSPDETAYFQSAKLFAETGSFIREEPLNAKVDNIIHPRNLGVWEGRIVPEGFIGLPWLTGVKARVLGDWVIELLTPLLAATGPIALYLLLRRIFDTRIAYLSALLMFVSPPYWYYASRGMMHAVAFSVFLVWGAYLLSVALTRRNVWLYTAAGASIGLALLMRTSEVLWVSAILVLVGILARRGLSWRGITGFALGGALALTPMFVFNWQFFGSPLSHALRDNFGADGGGSSESWWTSFTTIVAPFGWHLSRAWGNMLDYGLKIFPWLSIVAVLGLLGLISDWAREQWRSRRVDMTPRRWYLVVYIFIAAWLLLTYGSWDLQEYEDSSVLILGHSFLRYWLPMAILALPFFVSGVWRIVVLFPKTTRPWTLRFLVMIVVILSAVTVVGDPLYGLIKIRADVREYEQSNQIIQRETEPNAVIIAGRADKVIFPERRVIVEYAPEDDEYLKTIQKLSRLAPIYCYSMGVDDACQGLLGRTSLASYRAKLHERYKFDNGAVLFRLTTE